MKLSTITLSTLAVLAVAAPVAPTGPKLEDLPKQLQQLPKGVLKNVLFSDDKEQLLVVEDNHGARNVIVVDKTRDSAHAKREAAPKRWRMRWWYWVSRNWDAKPW